MNADDGIVFFSLNGVVFEKAFDIPKYMRGHVLYPAAVLKNAEQSFNFGATPFRFAPQFGFLGICSAAVEHSSCGVAGNAPLPATGTAKRPLAVILEPSLELAQQTNEELGKFSTFLPEPRVQLGLFMGGQSQAAQIAVLKKGVDVVTATPGRLIDLIQSKNLDCSDVRFLVLDEADKLMDGGNFKIVEQVNDEKKKKKKKRAKRLFFQGL